MEKRSNPHWEKNIATLHQTHPSLARDLERVPLEPERYRPAQAGDGSPVVALKLQNGRFAALGHSQSPVSDAQAWAKQFPDEMKVGANLLMMGFGSGYHPLALYEQTNSDTQIWIVEPDKVLFKTALYLMDFTSLFRSKRILFFVGASERETAQRLFDGKGSFRTLAQGIRLVSPPMSQYFYGTYIQNLSQAIQERIQFQGYALNTSEEQGRIIVNNILSNLPFLRQGLPVLSLISKLAGIPAYVIGPGPSLQDSIPLLHSLKGRGIVIAIDTAHRILLNHGIQADLVVSLDFTELNAKHFEAIEDDEAWLVAFPGIDTRITKQYAGKTLFYDHAGNADYSSGATQFLKSMNSISPLGDLISYGSTAHIAYHCARMMGCSPIVLIGNDLAVSGDRQYTQGAMQENLENKENAPLMDVPSNDGGSVKTIPLYKLYLNTFAELIQRTGGCVINTSPHGAQIPGVPYRAVDEILTEFPRQPFDWHAVIPKDKKRVIPCGESLREELMQYGSACRRARKGLQKLRGKLETVSPHSSPFKKEMLQFMKELAKFIYQEEAAVNISTALCSRKTVAFLGQLGDVGMFGGSTPEANQVAWQRTDDFFHDLLSAFKTNADLIFEAVGRCDSFHDD
ncbi:DUF115 domain-containing protein [bacterium]|nr:DUF115 domain-containing protein [bacterium]